MKWIAAILMILNVVVFLGVSDRQIAVDVQPVSTHPDVNRESMLLLSETGSGPGQTPGVDRGLPTVVTAPDILELGGEELTIPSEQDLALIALEEDDSENGDANSVAEAGATADSEIAEMPLTRSSIASTLPDDAGQKVALVNPGGTSCYRVGPFKDSSLWQEARIWADAENLSYKPVRSESREMRAVRVYIGPFASINESQPDVEILKQKELDYFVYLHDNNEARISLGYFTQEELAAKFVDHLANQGITARSQPEYRTLGPFDWMDLQVSGSTRDQVLAHDWGDGSILVNERACSSA